MHDPISSFGGVDWAVDGHAVCVVDGRGHAVSEFDVAHSSAGLGVLCQRLSSAGVVRVAIERPDGPVVDALLEAGFEVVVVSSRSVKALRGRYGTSGNKSDRSDAFILADCLRTDGHRWASLRPDHHATVNLRRHVRARKDLVAARVATTNQLRAHLRVVFPGAVGLFHDLDALISLRFLEQFPCPSKAATLSAERFEDWLRAHHYTGTKTGAELHVRLVAAPLGDTHDTGTVTLALLKVITALRTQIEELNHQLEALLDAHPDAVIFRSLPRCATVRAATLLAEIGDCRARFPDPESLACLAGVAPSTRASGRHRSVTFRFSSDKKLRDALCDFAGDTMRANTWADHRYRSLRAAGKSHPHAERILARSWAHIIWRCWHDHTPYDPARHTSLQQLTQTPT